MSGNSKDNNKKGKKEVRISEAIVSSSEGVLLLRRSRNNDLYVGKWQLPGGKVMAHETPLKAVKREIFEETGNKCSKVSLVKKISFEEDFKGKKSKVVLNVYSCQINGKVALSEDHSKAKFVRKSKISDKVLTPISKKAIFEE